MSEESNTRKVVKVDIGSSMKPRTVLDSLILPHLNSAFALSKALEDIGRTQKIFQEHSLNVFQRNERLFSSAQDVFNQHTRIVGGALKALEASKTISSSFALFSQMEDITKRWSTNFTLPQGFTESITAFNRLDSLFETAINANLTAFNNLPKPIISSTTEELVLSRHCLEVFADDPPEPEPLPIEPSSENLLQAYDQDLWTMYTGAHEAFLAKKTDYRRHVLTSLRELCNHLLHSLAPNERVEPWIQNHPDGKNLLHEQAPTRRARYLYICRNFDSEFIGEFATQDAKVLRTLFETLNRLHQKTPTISDHELEILFLRTRHFVEYTLTLSSMG